MEDDETVIELVALGLVAVGLLVAVTGLLAYAGLAWYQYMAAGVVLIVAGIVVMAAEMYRTGDLETETDPPVDEWERENL